MRYKALMHTAAVARDFLRQHGIEPIASPPYSIWILSIMYKSQWNIIYILHLGTQKKERSDKKTWYFHLCRRLEKYAPNPGMSWKFLG